jgi:hypothetical protein
MIIEGYEFGRIVVDGVSYRSDLIIFPTRVKAGWWRLEGHELNPKDIEEIIEEKPEVLIVGTGYNGRMVVLPETKKLLEEKGIELIEARTAEACRRYNEEARAGRRVCAALHLTC